MRVLKILLGIGFLFTLLGLYSILKGKIPVDPVRVMNPTSFASPEQIGAVSLRRFWVEVQQAQVIVLGSSIYVPEYDRPWHGFLSVARESGISVAAEFVFDEQGLRPLVPGGQPLNWASVRAAVEKIKSPQQKVFVHLISNDLNWKAASDLDMKTFMLFQNLMPSTDSAKAILEQGCRSAPSAAQQTAVDIRTLDCAAMQALSYGRRNKVDITQWSALIEKHSPNKFLLYIHKP